MKSATLFERFFATHERYYRDLELNKNGVEKFPAYFTLQVNAAIARKIKAEFDAMALYYREVGIPNAQKMVAELLDGYHQSQHKLDYADSFGKQNIFEDSFQSILREVLMGGYVAISHKLEMLMEFTKSHAEGKAYAALAEPNGHRIVNYIHILNDEFKLPFERLIELEHNVKPKNGIYDYGYMRQIITPRIFKIRMTANRIKHHGGYPKHAYDPIFEFYPNFDYYPDFGKDIKKRRTFRIPFTPEEFLLDLEYTEKYITQILEIFYNLNRYAIALEIAWVPARQQDIERRLVLIGHYLPSFRATIKNMVKQVKNVWLDKQIEPQHRLPKPTKFIFDESNL